MKKGDFWAKLGIFGVEKGDFGAKRNFFCQKFGGFGGFGGKLAVLGRGGANWEIWGKMSNFWSKEGNWRAGLGNFGEKNVQFWTKVGNSGSEWKIWGRNGQF